MPPPILLSWKAPCTTRRARAASPASTTSDRFSSEEPWAIAMTLIFASASAEKTRAAMPGVPAMPSPTTTSVAAPARPSTDRKSTRLNSSHRQISYAGFCLKKQLRAAPDERLRGHERAPHHARHHALPELPGPAPARLLAHPGEPHGGAQGGGRGALRRSLRARARVRAVPGGGPRAGRPLRRAVHDRALAGHHRRRDDERALPPPRGLRGRARGRAPHRVRAHRGGGLRPPDRLPRPRDGAPHGVRRPAAG